MSVYPRLRGERRLLSVAHAVAAGLSPATRGTRVGLEFVGFAQRFIPGYAGNAYLELFKGSNTTVYPRLRGERDAGNAVGTWSSGLSPATRGTHRHRFHRRVAFRFIPGYAGNAWTVTSGVSGLAVYPRLRGERERTSRPFMYSPGLSPATRGTQHHDLAKTQRRRFIPGYAGNARRVRLPNSGTAVYPRLRGERSTR